MRLFLLLCTSVFALSANARIKGLENIQGEWGSGGGNALVCFQRKVISIGGEEKTITQLVRENKNRIPDEVLQHIDSIEMFDLYEAKKKRGLSSVKPEIIEIGETEEYYDYIERLAKRYHGTVNDMYGFVEIGKNLIPDTNIIFHESAVEHQNDLGSVTLPTRHCIIATMAAQVNFNNFFELHIDERLFNHPKHSKQSKATLILHELIYAMARKHAKHTDSGSTRNIVRMLMSYHPDITEGAVSKAINDLDLLKVFWPNATGISLDKQYAASTTIQVYKNMWKNVFHNMQIKFKFWMDWPDTKLLYETVLRSYLLESIGEESSVEKSMLGLKKMITQGLIKSTNELLWKDYLKQFDIHKVALFKDISESIKYYRTGELFNEYIGNRAMNGQSEYYTDTIKKYIDNELAYLASYFGGVIFSPEDSEDRDDNEDSEVKDNEDDDIYYRPIEEVYKFVHDKESIEFATFTPFRMILCDDQGTKCEDSRLKLNYIIPKSK